jgi:probable rRNA maturation factor
MILNRQSKVKIDPRRTASLARQLLKTLALEGKDFTVCFVDDEKIKQLNAAYRQKATPTDVLSFPWQAEGLPNGSGDESAEDPGREFDGFLGDVVISVETARRNARAEGQAPATEISWLILHGLLHLIGMDHETDNGEMTALEHRVRARLGLNGQPGLNTKSGSRADSRRRAPARRSNGARRIAAKQSGH